MEISVIIPVFNAEPFLRKAVKSALSQEETAEIILVEDASKDNSLEICRELASAHEKVKLFRHPDGGNHGAGASRNLGIEKASCDFIAFLDADDYYLPERFKKDKEVLHSDPSIDGVYNALGIHYYEITEKLRKDFQNRELTTVKELIPPEQLFENMAPIGNMGYFHCNTLTVKKSVFQRVGFFNTKLILTQDTQMWIRMAAVCRLVPGNINSPVAIRGVHEKNRSKGAELNKYQFHLYDSLFDWAVKNKITHSRILTIWEILFRQNTKRIYKERYLKRRFLQFIFLIDSSIKYSRIIPFFILSYLPFKKLLKWRKEAWFQ